MEWKPLNKILFRFFFVFVLLFINSFSFPHRFIPDTGNFTNPFFEWLAQWSAEHIFHLQKPYIIQLISDSAGMYINTFNLIFISILVSFIWRLFDKKRGNYNILFYWFFVLIRYYLALQLFEYGFNKVFKWQFYLPEPNTLFTALGETPRDLLYWSTMGVSRPYTICMGTAEIIAGSLLLFRRTTLLGALCSLIIMINVLLINLCYDINVKLYSCFLLLLCIILITPHYKRLFSFFLKNKSEELLVQMSLPVFFKKKRVYTISKTLVILFILSDVLLPYFRSKNFNDDLEPRPFLHGAYNVETFVKNSDTVPPLLTDNFRWRRFFIHRQGYFISQNMKDEMSDFTLEYDTITKKLLIDSSNVILNYRVINDSTLFLSGKVREDSLKIIARKIDLKKLWLLKEEFGWTLKE